MIERVLVTPGSSVELRSLSMKKLDGILKVLNLLKVMGRSGHLEHKDARVLVCVAVAFGIGTEPQTHLCFDFWLSPSAKPIDCLHSGIRCGSGTALQLMLCLPDNPIRLFLYFRSSFIASIGHYG